MSNEKEFSSEVVAVETAIDQLLGMRRPGATICPSEVARVLTGEDGDWRARMEPVRAVAAGLARAGRLVVLQGGRQVDIETARGPVRLGRVLPAQD